MGNRLEQVSICGGDIWSKIEFDLSECRDLFYMLQETKVMGKGQKIPLGSNKVEWRDTAPRWVDDEHGVSSRSWLMIPHVDAVDHEAIYEWLEAGKRLLGSVHQGVNARKLTPELMQDWGLLNRWAGRLELVYHMKPDARLLRAGDDNLSAQKRWFAYYYLKIQPSLRRDDALEVMEGFINSIITNLSSGPEQQWFAKFLGPKKSDSLANSRRLTKAFREKLSVLDMEELSAHPLDIIPSFAFRYSLPLGGD